MIKNELKIEVGFQLKSDFLPLTVIKLSSNDLAAISAQLNETIEQAPKYFNDTPIILDVNNLKLPAQDLNLKEICQTLREKKIIPIGIRGLKSTDIDLAAECGLAIFKNPRSIIEQVQPIPTPKPVAQPTITTLNVATKIITSPIRSGNTVYAPGGDLVIMAAVNVGAECIADGNIHIYGALRGRALAGAKGNTEARIFCRELDAELVSIAGQYLVRENIKMPKLNSPAIQIYLQNKSLLIEGI